MNPLSVLLSLSVPCRRTTVSVMSLHTQCWFLRRVRCRSVTSPLARPTCSESRLSAQRENQEVTTWSMSSRPCPWVGALETGYFFSNVQTRFLCHLSVLWSNCVLLFFFLAESQIQNNSTVVMGAVVGGGIMLLVVVVVLLLHKRLEHTTAIISLCPKIVYDYGWLTGQS